MKSIFRAILRLNELADSSRQASADLQALLSEVQSLKNEASAMRAELAYISRLTETTQFMNAVADARHADPASLAPFGLKMYSQHREDGVVSEIFNRIGRRDQTFLEIGIGDGRENTTRFLLESGWRGTWIEGSPEWAESAKSFMHEYVADGRLKVVQALVTAENINQILDEAEVPAQFDYLSLDIDYNTSHVWKAMQRRSRVACIEFNCTMPPNVAMTVPYDPNGVWDGTAWYGASLKAMENIGTQKAMALVGCDLNGVNSYFVNLEEAKGKFKEPFDSNTHFEPPRPAGYQHRAPSVPRKWNVEA